MVRGNNTPALKLFVPFSMGIIAGYYLNLPLLSIFTICLVLIFFKKCSKISVVFIFIQLFFIGMLHYELDERLLPAHHISYFTDIPSPVALEGVVIKPVDRYDQRTVVVVQVDSIWIHYRPFFIRGLVLLTIRGNCHWIRYGDRIVFKGLLQKPRGQRNPGEFDYSHYLRAQKIQAILSLSDQGFIVRIDEDKGLFLLQKIIIPLRNKILNYINLYFDEQHNAILKALIIGDRGDVDIDTQEAFADVGAIHVLAVSGLHVGFIAAGLIGLFRFLRIPSPWRLIPVFICLFFYAMLTGLRASVFRATIFIIVHLFGTVIQRRTNLLNTCAISAIIILAVNPAELFQSGFQLSFAAIVGIALFYNRFDILSRKYFFIFYQKKSLLISSIVSLILLSLSAQITTLPLVVYYFHRIPLFSILVNLIVVPLVALIVCLTMISLSFSFFFSSIGAIFADTIWLLLCLLLKTVQTAHSIPFSYFECFSFSHFFIVYGILISFVVFRNIKRIVIFFLILSNISIWRDVCFKQIGLKVTFFDVGQGDAALYEFPNGKNLLIDTGDCTDYFNAGQMIIAPYLKRNSISSINNMLLTHSHSDHVGGVPYLFENLKIDRLIISRSFLLKTGVKIDSLAKCYRIKIQNVCAGDTLFIDKNALILVLNPVSEILDNMDDKKLKENDLSIVLKCIYKNKSFLMMGDAEIEAEKWIMNYDRLLASDVIKLGHHGSETASSEPFRHKVDASYGIVSVGKNNKFGLPSEYLLDCFIKEKTIILRTDSHGAIQFFVSYNGQYKLCD